MASQDHDLKLLFTLFDVDNSGTLTNEELKKLLQSPDPLGPKVSEEQVAGYVKLADKDNSGDVSVDEFVAFVKSNIPEGTYGLKSIFRTIDKNGDGSVERNEFENAKANITDLNPTLVQILDKRFQQSSVSEITYEQFVEGVNEYYNSLQKS